MGKTIAEKIFHNHLTKDSDEAKAGNYVLASPDIILLNDVSGPVAIKQFDKIGAEKVANKENIVIVLDHFSPPPNIDAAQNNKMLRDFAKKQGLKNIFEIGEGIEHTLLPESGFIKPGSLIIGGDSHTTTYGAFNSLGTGFGATDMGVSMALGYLWFLVPESINFEINGKRPPFVTGKDLVLNIIDDIGVDGATYMSMEFSGDALLKFNVDEYMHISNMSVEAGAKSGIFQPNDNIILWAKSKFLSQYDKLLVKSDFNANYYLVKRYDISKMEPMIAKPHSPGNISPISEVEGIPVNQVYIGNCANGTLTDLRQAASILKGKKIAKGVRLIVVAATRSIYIEALKEGLIETFLNAGAFVTHSTCGACAGLHMGLLADEEIAITTTNRNFQGRMGSSKAKVYLSNAFVAAASAIKGEITDPRKLAEWNEVSKFVYG
ncbi:MAG: 3-isopropylmalate dehydratase large subunit [Caldisphaera sp.]|jgi:3-isopropylmalate/(R)-2-methylmalate dehydratase large subunit|nr:MAG: 3-isopropylmalate dehydratase large subunit [Caldisphaera sp.]